LTRHGLAVAELEVHAGPNHVVLQEAQFALDATGWEDFLRRASGELSLVLPDPAALLGDPAPAWTHGKLELALSLGSGRAQVTGRCELEGAALVIERGEIALQQTPPSKRPR
jgi:hypothetical protein